MHDLAFGRSRHRYQQNVEERVGQLLIGELESASHSSQRLCRCSERPRSEPSTESDMPLMSLTSFIWPSMLDLSTKDRVQRTNALPSFTPSRFHSVMRRRSCCECGPSRSASDGRTASKIAVHALGLEMVDRGNPQTIRISGQRSTGWLLRRSVVDAVAGWLLRRSVVDAVVDAALRARRPMRPPNGRRACCATVPRLPPQCHLHLRTKALRVGPMRRWPTGFLVFPTYRYHIRRRPCYKASA